MINTCTTLTPSKPLGNNGLKGQYRRDQSRLSTGHGIGVLDLDELSD